MSSEEDEGDCPSRNNAYKSFGTLHDEMMSCPLKKSFLKNSSNIYKSGCPLLPPKPISLLEPNLTLKKVPIKGNVNIQCSIPLEVLEEEPQGLGADLSEPNVVRTHKRQRSFVELREQERLEKIQKRSFLTRYPPGSYEHDLNISELDNSVKRIKLSDAPSASNFPSTSKEKCDD